jgi:hypothetical protein
MRRLLRLLQVLGLGLRPSRLKAPEISSRLLFAVN